MVTETRLPTPMDNGRAECPPRLRHEPLRGAHAPVRPARDQRLTPARRSCLRHRLPTPRPTRCWSPVARRDRACPVLSRADREPGHSSRGSPRDSLGLLLLRGRANPWKGDRYRRTSGASSSICIGLFLPRASPGVGGPRGFARGLPAQDAQQFGQGDSGRPTTWPSRQQQASLSSRTTKILGPPSRAGRRFRWGFPGFRAGGFREGGQV